MNERISYASGLKPSEREEDSNSPDNQVVCLQNIGPSEQRRRLRGGLVALAAGLVLGAILLYTGTSPWWRLLLFLPFAAGGIGFFQAREKT